MAATEWHERASALQIDGRLLARVARGDRADIDCAVAAARAAFDDRRWAGKSPAARKRTLIEFADLILKNKAELALLETLDMGKPIKYSQCVDVAACANCSRWYGEAIDKVYDEIAPTSDASLALITREPVGVVGAILPWNYPLIMTAWKIAPALAAGNSVVSGGFYIAPTLFDGVDGSMSIANEEIFGPVLSVLSFTDIKDAVRQANATPYGLQAAVWTRDSDESDPDRPRAARRYRPRQPVRQRRHDGAVRRR